MDLRITTLSENTANYGFLAEWGLSLLVEVDDLRLLVDCGLSYSAVHNAELLGLDLRGIDRIILSHGHADHTGGLREVLRRGRGAEVIAHPAIWEAKFARFRQERERYVGLPFRREELESLGARFTLSTRPIALGPGIATTGEVPLSTDYEAVDADLFIKVGTELRPDPVADDLSLYIRTPLGLVVVLGCAHRGIINTLRHVTQLAGEESIYAVIGGTHLFRASPERLERTVAELQGWGIQKIGVSHCTGFKACALLAERLGDAFIMNNAGTRLKLL